MWRRLLMHAFWVGHMLCMHPLPTLLQATAHVHRYGLLLLLLLCSLLQQLRIPELILLLL